MNKKNVADLATKEWTEIESRLRVDEIGGLECRESRYCSKLIKAEATNGLQMH